MSWPTISLLLPGRAGTTRGAIVAEQLHPGERLPSARGLAAQLGAARGTVEAAYAILAGEGWIIARGAAGTIVTPQLAQAASATRSAPAPSRHGASDNRGGQPEPRPFRMGLPALDAFPRKLWARLVAREARALSEAGLGYPDPAGDVRLREADRSISRDLARRALRTRSGLRHRRVSGRA